MTREIYLNGRIMPFGEASISPDERALHFSESVYEVIRVYGGRPLEMGRHMRRLIASAEYLGIDLRSTVDEIAAQSEELLRRSGLSDALIYVQVTTGAAPRAHLRPDGLVPTILATVSATPPTPARWISEGMSAITVPDERWARCHVKTTMLLVNTNAKKRAADLGQDDAIFIRDGFVTEATAGNIFAVFGGLLVTPPKSNYILHGITRELVIELALEMGIPCEEGPVPQSALYRADELFLTGTAFELASIVVVDGKPVGSGKPGSLSAQLTDAFRLRATEL